MKDSPKITALCAIVGIALIVGCAGGGGASRPTTGTERIFEVGERNAISAVTNAFGSGQYHDMLLGQAVGSDYLAKGWHPTNGFLLLPGIFSSYHAFFHVVVVPLAANQTKVLVRTVCAQAVDGKEPGVHGGWAFHFKEITPDPVEEQNVLAAIANELNAEKSRAGMSQ